MRRRDAPGWVPSATGASVKAIGGGAAAFSVTGAVAGTANARRLTPDSRAADPAPASPIRGGDEIVINCVGSVGAIPGADVVLAKKFCRFGTLLFAMLLEPAIGVITKMALPSGLNPTSATIKDCCCLNRNFVMCWSVTLVNGPAF